MKPEHIEILKEITRRAEAGDPEPWKGLQIKNGSRWCDLGCMPALHPITKYRWKPVEPVTRTVTLTLTGQLKGAPEVGAKYWLVDASNNCSYPMLWVGDETEEKQLAAGVLFDTKENCDAFLLSILAAIKP